jgi:hypothetical protein
MEAFTQFDYQNPTGQYNNAVQECSSLDSEFRREFIQAINKGALSRCENLLNALDDGECKQWLKKRLLEMDFESIRSFIVSA